MLWYSSTKRTYIRIQNTNASLLLYKGNNYIWEKNVLSMQLSDMKYPTPNLQFQIHSTALYLDALDGSVKWFPVRRVYIRSPFQKHRKYELIKEDSNIQQNLSKQIFDIIYILPRLHTCPNCFALSFDFVSSENNVTSFIAHISPLSLIQYSRTECGKHQKKSLLGITKIYTNTCIHVISVIM